MGLFSTGRKCKMNAPLTFSATMRQVRTLAENMGRAGANTASRFTALVTFSKATSEQKAIRKPTYITMTFVISLLTMPTYYHLLQSFHIFRSIQQISQIFMQN